MLNDKLQKIDNLKQELDSLRPLKQEQLEGIKTMYDVELTYNSNAIEGSTLDYAETKIILLEGLTIGGKTTREHLEAINHKDAIDYIEQIAQKKTKNIKRTDVLAVHRIILRGIDNPNAGQYRLYDVYVNKGGGEKHMFPEPSKIVNLMDNFYLWIKENKNMHPVLLASEAHYRLVSIHPFIDGNGRCARLLMNLILIQNGFPPAIIKMAKRREYISTIQTTNENNMNEFYNFIADAELESLELYLDTVKNNIIWK